MKRETVAFRDAGLQLVEDGRGPGAALLLERIYCVGCGRVELFGALRWNVKSRKPDVRCGACWATWGESMVWWNDVRERLQEMGRQVDAAVGAIVVLPAGFWEGW